MARRPGGRAGRARRAIAALTATATALALTATASAATQTLSVTKGGAGTGTVTSFPAGIACGSTCSGAFAEGALVTLTATPGTNSAPAQWSGCDAVTGEGKCQVTISSARSVSATFNLLQRQLTVTKAGSGTGTVTSSPGGIQCGSSCQASYTHGTALALSAVSGALTEAVKWSGCESVTLEDRCLLTMSAAKTVTATFPAEPKLSVTKAGPGAGAATIASSPPGIACGTSCQASYEAGTEVTLSAVPGTHSKAAQWTGCDAIGAGKCIVTLSASRAVTATFNPQPPYTAVALSVQKTGNGQGTVSGSPGQILCGAICTESLISGQSIALTASPSPGSVFAHWSGGGCTGAGLCTATVKRASTVKAVFTLSGQRTLSVQKAGTGQGTVAAKAVGIDCGQSCSAQVPAAKKVTLSARAAKGSAFAHWSGACSGTKTCKVQMTEARSVTATFSGSSAPAPPPVSCVVPKLKGKSPSQARTALSAAHCALGKVSKPKARKGHKLGSLVVKSFSPAAGSTLPAGGKVSLKLKRAGRRKAHRR